MTQILFTNCDHVRYHHAYHIKINSMPVKRSRSKHYLICPHNLALSTDLHKMIIYMIIFKYRRYHHQNIARNLY